MSSVYTLLILVGYFGILMIISYFTGGDKEKSNLNFFIGKRKSPWYVVAFGMIGTTLSGLTFISVPGRVEDTSWSYLQLILGNLVGYWFIALVLLPLYYRLQHVSIYGYLSERYGQFTYRTGAILFMISRGIGSSFRLFLTANVLQYVIFDGLGVPYYVTVFVTIGLIFVYTYRGGIRTIVWTDTLQTASMIVSAVVSIILISESLNIEWGSLANAVSSEDTSRIFFFDDWGNPNNFWKQFLSGVFLAIVMSGLDQDIMQKNLSCPTLKDAQKNMMSFSFVLFFVNMIFLALGTLLLLYAHEHGIDAHKDLLYPAVATDLGVISITVFIIGVVAAAYSSADSALTALTTSFCVDVLQFDSKPVVQQLKTRKVVHLSLGIAIGLLIMVYKYLTDESVVALVFTLAGYTYGPLLGFYAFGMLVKNQPIIDRHAPWIALLGPILSFGLKQWVESTWGYVFGFELLIAHGILIFMMLWISSLLARNKSTIQKA